MRAATDRQCAVRDAVLYWLLITTTEGRRNSMLDADTVGEAVGWLGSPLTQDEVADATRYLYRQGHVTGVPVVGLGIPRPVLTVAGRRVARKDGAVHPTTHTNHVGATPPHRPLDDFAASSLT